jgi:hypothetical protein
MKKLLALLLAAAVCTAAALTFTACSDPIEESPAIEDPIVDDNVIDTPAELPDEHEDLDPPPTDEQVEAAYLTALEACGWFTLTTLSTDVDDSVEEDGNTFYRVTDERFSTYQELETYLKTIFTERFVDELLAADEKYRDIDGALYAIDAARGGNILLGEQRGKVIIDGVNRIIYRVTVDILDEPEGEVVDTQEFDFVYIREPDAALDWHFDTFECLC